ncbi:MAG: hypothetical protein ND866_03465, partial [Pyrinomonadaceae bacterium]|nr:hypothetical protein [Pyrinomonadaceae bacterium]
MTSKKQLAMRGFCLSYETVREWCPKFGQTYANGLRRRSCPSPILDRTRVSLNFIMLLAVHNGDAACQPQQSQLPYPLPAAVLVSYQARLCPQISASSYDAWQNAYVERLIGSIRREC